MPEGHVLFSDSHCRPGSLGAIVTEELTTISSLETGSLDTRGWEWSFFHSVMFSYCHSMPTWAWSSKAKAL